MQLGGVQKLIWQLLVAAFVCTPALAEDAPVPPTQLGPEAPAKPSPSPESARENDTRESICLIIEAAARDANLPLEFFARVIWQESRFQADAVGPTTRSGEHAQGIAQFMPGTASERGLLNPFNPVQALPKSAEFLNELRNQFGNLALRPLPTTQVRGACRNGSPAPAACRSRPAITFSPSPGPASKPGPRQVRPARARRARRRRAVAT